MDDVNENIIDDSKNVVKDVVIDIGCRDELMVEDIRISDKTSHSRSVLKMSEDINDSICSPPSNEWNDNSERTIRKWMNKVHRTAFTYSHASNAYRSSRRKFNNAAFVLGIVSTTMAAITVAIGVLNLKWPVFGINILVLILGGLSTFFAGYPQVNNWDFKIYEYYMYTERLGGLWIEFRTVMDIPKSIRTAGTNFIKHMHGKYIILMQQGPAISGRDSANADKSYSKSSPEIAFSNKFG
jgi:hypothetical protein